MRRGIVQFFDDAGDFFQLCHQIIIRLQATGCINHQHINLLGFGAFQCLISQTGGITARLARHHRHAGARAPNLQLLSGGGAKCITGSQHNRLALGDEFLRQLANSGGLARPVNAGH